MFCFVVNVKSELISWYELTSLLFNLIWRIEFEDWRAVLSILKKTCLVDWLIGKLSLEIDWVEVNISGFKIIVILEFGEELVKFIVKEIFEFLRSIHKKNE